MTSIEFIEKEIATTKKDISIWKVGIETKKYLKEKLQTLQQIKSKLEAWGSVKELIHNSNGVYLLRVDSDDEDDKEHYIRIEKALEVKEYE